MIRRALVADALAVHALLLSAKDDIPLHDNFADARHQDWVRDRCREKRVWIDARDPQIAGVAVVMVTEIFYLVTAEPYRKQGVGLGLVEHIIADVQRRYRCGVEARTRDDNQSALAILRRKGFRRHPYKEAHDGWGVYAYGKVN